MYLKKINFWFLSSLLVSIFVAIPIVTVFTSFFEDTSNYYQILKDTFLFEYIFNSLVLLISVLVLTFLIGTSTAYLVSFYKFPFSNFFKWALILSFAVPPYIYAYSLTAFFENYGTLYSILKNLFGEANYNQSIPKFDGLIGAVLSLSFSLFAYAAFATSVLIIAGRNLVRINYDQLRYEADFRYGLVHVRDNAESIAFYSGEAPEKAETQRRLSTVVNNFNLRDPVNQKNA